MTTVKSDTSPPALPGTAVALARGREDKTMSNIFYIIGVIVVIVAILGFLGLR